MKVEVTRCDICREIIDEPDANGMVSITGGSQVWSTPGGERDVCGDCLCILQQAAHLGMIEIEMAQFYARAGFTQDEYGHWKRPDGETIYNPDALNEQMAELLRTEENQK